MALSLEELEARLNAIEARLFGSDYLLNKVAEKENEDKEKQADSKAKEETAIKTAPLTGKKEGN
jgi:hypothetical protein